jgi:16S rRNA (cytosine967-C5)-methyltransferase
VSFSARLVAFEVMQAVHNDDAYSNLLLPAAITNAKLDPRDSGFATELTYGGLRRQGSLDAVIKACSDREDIDSAVHDVLRIGAYQLLFMRVPDHAAVSETVDLARKVVGVGASKFVNAVMRKVATKDWPTWVDELTKDLAPVEKLSIEYSYPVWVIRVLADAYKCDGETIKPILEAGNTPASISLVARPGQFELADLLALPQVEKGNWSPLAGVMKRVDGQSMKPGDLTAIQDNRVGVQDEGSQLVALALVNATVDQPESNWLDMCAGPGGKAAILAGFAPQHNAQLTAIEPIAGRARLVENSLRNAPGDPQVIVIDAREFETTQKFDRILVDAPCTGLGALRRRPEARWRKQPSDVAVLAKLQTELLAKAAQLIKAGGVIGYATCSPHIAETDSIVNDFMKNNPGFELMDISQALPQLNLPTGSTAMRLNPIVHETDGMYLALIKKSN